MTTLANRSDKKKNIFTVIMIALAVILIAAALLFYFGFNLLNKLNRPDDTQTEPSYEPKVTATPTPVQSETPEPSPTPEAIVPTDEISALYEQSVLSEENLKSMEDNLKSDKVINILLLGVDRRNEDENSRADTAMIATIDKENGRLKLTSIMRDLLVYIDGHGYNKINAASAYGGVDLYMKTVNDNFHMNIDEYVLVDFSAFEQVVDALGGVTVYMSSEEISAANDCIAGLNRQMGIAVDDGFIYAQEGNVLLNGKQALGYARIRKIDNDFHRTQRQYNLLSAIFAEFKAAGVARQYAMLEQLLPLVETNMSNTKIIECAISALNIKTKGILYHRLPADGLYKSGRWNGAYVLLTDIPKNALLLHEFIFESDMEPDTLETLKPGEDGNATAEDYSHLAGEHFMSGDTVLTVDQYGNLINDSGEIVYYAGTWKIEY